MFCTDRKLRYSSGISASRISVVIPVSGLQVVTSTYWMTTVPESSIISCFWSFGLAFWNSCHKNSFLKLIPVLGNASADFNIKQKLEKRKDPSKGKKVHKIIILVLHFQEIIECLGRLDFKVIFCLKYYLSKRIFVFKKDGLIWTK